MEIDEQALVEKLIPHSAVEGFDLATRPSRLALLPSKDPPRTSDPAVRPLSGLTMAVRPLAGAAWGGRWRAGRV